MIKPEELLQYLPAVKGRKDLLIEDQSSTDIVNELLNAAIYFQPDYNKIPKDTFKNLREIWLFTKNTFTYKEDSELAQDLKAPAVMLSDAIRHSNTIDCKGYSLFIAGIIQNMGYKNWFFKFASYTNEPDPTHVYIVCNDKILDCCQNRYDKESETTHYICANPFNKKNMAINRISGTKKIRKRLNHNPSIFGRQRKYGMIGEGSGGGKGGGGKGQTPKPDKQGTSKDPKDPKVKDTKDGKEMTEAGITVPIPAPHISITRQPEKSGGYGDFIVKPDITFAASLAYPISFVFKNLTATGKAAESRLTKGINLVTGYTFNNLPEGQYECFFQLEVKGKKIKSNSTRFLIKAIDSVIEKKETTKNKKEPAIKKDNTIFTTQNIAIGAAVIIGGYYLTKKSK